MTIDSRRIPQLADLLIEIRRARRCFLASGRSRPYWDSLAAAVRQDYRSGVSLPAIQRMVAAWTGLLESRPEPRGRTFLPRQIANRADASAQKETDYGYKLN